MLELAILPLAIAAAAVDDDRSVDQIKLDAPALLRADGAVITTGDGIGHSGPQMTDINHDGLLDLLVGDFAGHIRVHLNVGSAREPQWAKQTYLEASGERIKINNW